MMVETREGASQLAIDERVSEKDRRIRRKEPFSYRVTNGDPVKKSRILDRPSLMDSTELLEWWLSIDPQSEESRHHDLLSGEMESGDDDGGALLFAPISEKAKLVRNSDVVVCNQSCRIARGSE